MEYVPGGSSGTVKPPDSFVVAVRSKEVALFWIVMLAPATAAEFWSSTVPLKVAAVDWAPMGVKYKGTRTKRNLNCCRENYFAIKKEIRIATKLYNALNFHILITKTF